MAENIKDALENLENKENKENKENSKDNFENPQPEVESNESKVEEVVEKTAEEKYQELYNEYLRLMADFDNYRKRTIKERAELIKSAGSDTIKSILPVIDDLERAIAAAKKTDDIQSVREGLDLIHKKMIQILKEKGLEPIETIGKDFDVNAHEAITNIPATEESQKGKVIDEIEKGYMLQGKVIRYAKVAVAI